MHLFLIFLQIIFILCVIINEISATESDVCYINGDKTCNETSNGKYGKGK